LSLVRKPRCARCKEGRSHPNGRYGKKNEPHIRADLSGAYLVRVRLDGANLCKVNLSKAELSGADLSYADLEEADLEGANLYKADLRESDLARANLQWADLQYVDLSWVVLQGANLWEANLESAMLLETNLRDAVLTGCRVYGASVWAVTISEKTEQRNLIITREDEPEITVDNIRVAQLIYLLLSNAELRGVIETITAKAVLILGRFTEDRKVVLDALRDKLRKRDYLPILFDFDKPASRTTNETISCSRMARFVIADISDAKSVLQELQAIVPDLRSVPVQPVIIATQEEPGMFDSHRGLPWFLPAHRYDTLAQLLADLSGRVIGPAEAKVRELRALAVAPAAQPGDAVITGYVLI
jgi:uncharacterized protein YjbI with pentapeptide repeats